VFVAAMGVQLFFSWTNYGFLYNEVLLWICLVNSIILLVGLTVWRCRYFFWRKALTVIACVLLSLFAIFAHFAILLASVFGGHTSTDAGSISGNRHYIHASPEGTNQFVIMFTGMDEESIYAYPMLNRWIYKEVDNGFVWEAHVHEDEYTVEWQSENLAVVEVNTHYCDDEIIEGENLDHKIIVDFSGV